MKQLLVPLLLLLSFATASSAQIGRPETRMDTLGILAEAFRNAPEIKAVDVNRGDVSLVLTMPDDSQVTSYPDNLHLQLQTAESDVQRQGMVDGFVRNLVEGFAQSDRPIIAENIFPVIRRAGYGQAQGGPQPFAWPFVGGLQILFAEDLPTSLRYLTEAQITALSLTPETIGPIAMENFLRHEVPMQIEGNGPYILISDGNYEASYLLDVGLWQRVDAKLGSVILIVPARDLVIFADGDIAGNEALLRGYAKQAIPEMSYPLSEAVLVWKGNHWEVL